MTFVFFEGNLNMGNIFTYSFVFFEGNTFETHLFDKKINALENKL